MEYKNILGVLAFIAFFLVLINISVVFIKISNFKEISGEAVYSGAVNITLLSFIDIDLPKDSIVWGQGSIDEGELNATLYTRGDSNGIVERGNWSGVNANGFVVRNIGTVNATLYVKAEKTAHEFFSSSNNSNEEYMWNITEKEVGSCSGGITKKEWFDVNKTGLGTKICEEFSPVPSNNEIYIDILLTIPSDAANIGEQFDSLTITANA
jgi:hypothetical protein